MMVARSFKIPQVAMGLAAPLQDTREMEEVVLCAVIYLELSLHVFPHQPTVFSFVLLLT